MIRRLRLGLEARSGWGGWGRQLRVRPPWSGLALGVILVGLVGEAADQHEAPELGGIEGKAAAGLGAEQDGAEPSRRGLRRRPGFARSAP